jgi:uncharacterized protein (TIGR00266 family)
MPTPMPIPMPAATAPTAVVTPTTYAPALKGTFGPTQYEILYSPGNSLVKIIAPPGETITAKQGVLVGMSPNIHVSTKSKGFGALLTGGGFYVQQLTPQHGLGEILLAPAFLGDIVPLLLDGRTEYWVSKRQFLASTSGVQKQQASQGLMQGMMSGEGFLLDRFIGQGMVFLQILGSSHVVDLRPGEQYIIDNGHLVAWSTTTSYKLEFMGGSLFSGMKSGEGMVCRFTGPGKVYIQTRNPQELGRWIMSVSGGGAR